MMTPTPESNVNATPTVLRDIGVDVVASEVKSGVSCFWLVFSRDELDKHGLICSMSRKGDCWDNAVSESFFKTLKVERVNDRDYWTREEAKTDINDYIERFYNRKRRHSYLGYISPVEYELQKAA